MRKLNHNKIIELYKNGNSCNKIAKCFECSDETIRKILISNNIVRRGDILTRNPKYSYENIVQMYTSGINTSYIAKELGTYNTTIRRILLKNNIKLRTSADVWDKRKLLFDNSEEAQYWIGFLAADGALFKNNNAIRIVLAEKDKNHVYKFSKFCNSSVAFNVDKRFNKKLFRTSFNSKKNADYLKSIGVTSNKSFTLELKVPINRHILRGVIDGDGSISKEGLVSIVSASNRFILQLRYFLNKNNIHNTLTKQNKLFVLRVSKYSEIYKLYDLIYKDASIYLERKQDRMRLAYMKM